MIGLPSYLICLIKTSDHRVCLVRHETNFSQTLSNDQQLWLVLSSARRPPVTRHGHLQGTSPRRLFKMAPTLRYLSKMVLPWGISLKWLLPEAFV